MCRSAWLGEVSDMAHIVHSRAPLLSDPTSSNNERICAAVSGDRCITFDESC